VFKILVLNSLRSVSCFTEVEKFIFMKFLCKKKMRAIFYRSFVHSSGSRTDLQGCALQAILEFVLRLQKKNIFKKLRRKCPPRKAGRSSKYMTDLFFFKPILWQKDYF